MEMQEGNDMTFDSRSVWEKLKDKLDDELDEDSSQQAFLLMKDKLFFPKDVFMDTLHPRQWLELLENNYAEKECFEILRHVFNIMPVHLVSEGKNFTEVIEEYEKQLPRDRMDLIGRDEQIQDVTKSLVENKYKGIWLCGLGGMGKTTLAEEICHRLKYNHNYIFFNVDMKGKSSLVDLSQEILIAQNLVWRESDEKSNDRESSTTSSKESILKLHVLQSLCNLGNESVLLLDNMDDLQREEGGKLVSYLRNILSEISKLGEQCKLRMIVTARHKFLNVISSGYDDIHLREIELNRLSEDDGIKLAMKSALPRHLTEEESSQVAEACGGCPLAICIMARYIRAQFMYPVTQVISSIKWRLSDIVPCCIETSFDDLPHGTKEQFIQLFVFNICPFNVQSAAAIWFEDTSQQSIAKTEMGLLQLKYRHLVECGMSCDPTTQGLLTKGEKDPVIYSLHPLVFSSLDSLLRNNRYLEKSSDLAKARFLELYINKLLLVEESLERERNQVIQIAASDKVHFQNIFLWNSTLPFSTTSNRKCIHSLGIKTSMLLTTFAKVIYKPEETLKVFRNLAETSRRSHNKDAFYFWSVKQADACLDCDMVEEAEEILQHLICEGQDYCKAESTVDDVYRLFTDAEFHYVHGMLCNKKKHYSNALEEFDKSVELYKTCKPEGAFTVCHADAINAKGNVHFKLEDYSSALKCHETAYELIERRFEGNFHEHKPLYLHNIGSIYHVRALKNWKRSDEETMDLLRKALETYEKCIELDSVYKQTADPYHAHRLRIRSDIYLRMKRFSEAITDAKKALKIQRDVYIKNHPSITISRYQLARCYMKRAKKYRKDGLKEKADADITKCWLTFVQVQDDIKKGGLTREDQLYLNIRNDHLKLVQRYGYRKQHWKIERFYDRFEEKGRLGQSRESETSDSTSSDTDEDLDYSVDQSHDESASSGCPPIRISSEGLPSISSVQSISLENALSTEDNIFKEGVRPEATPTKERGSKRTLSDSDD